MEREQYLKEMGARIKALRKARKMSLPQLSRVCKTDTSNLWRVENGEKNSRILTLIGIAEALGVEITDFL